MKPVVQSYFDFRPYWTQFPEVARICHVFDTINAKYVLTATEGQVLGFRRIFCSGGSSFPSRRKKEGRKGLFDKPDTCVLFSRASDSRLSRTERTSLCTHYPPFPRETRVSRRACYSQTRSYDFGNYCCPRYGNYEGWRCVPTLYTGYSINATCHGLL